MAETKFDMEVTPERADFMKRTLLRLYADQMGMDIVSVQVQQVQPANKAKEETA